MVVRVNVDGQCGVYERRISPILLMLFSAVTVMKSPRNSPQLVLQVSQILLLQAHHRECTQFQHATPTPSSIVLRLNRACFEYYPRQIFSDLFTVPQPVEGVEEMIEGCRIVHLPDSESEFVDLLTVYISQSAFPYPLLSSSDCYLIILLLWSCQLL